ncbi:MAG TPA: peptidylprolyl isomerase [Gammaproteobacteria bacterium]|nr:peptidylprolyl isomerase [Gammaproteobacteria bacterium]
MRASLATLLPLILLAACSQAPVQPAAAPATPPLPAHPLVKIETNLGDMTVRLDTARAPLTVTEFLQHAQAHKYDNTSFYRIMPGFVIQAGDFTSDYKPLPEEKPIPNESGNGLSNLRGTIGLAREADPHTGSYVFYINLADNRKLDPRPDRWGYAVFGQVVEGLDVMDKIAAVPTHDLTTQNHDEFPNAPVTPVTIEKVVVLPPEAPGAP